MISQERRTDMRRTIEDRRKSSFSMINSYLADDDPSRRSGQERRMEVERRKSKYH